jgi:hypothetical protein
MEIKYKAFSYRFIIMVLLTAHKDADIGDSVAVALKVMKPD